MNRKDRSAFDTLNLVPEHFICLKADRACMSGVSLRSTLLAFHFVRCCSLSLSSLTKLKHDVLFIKFIRCLKVNDAEWICLSFCRSLRHYFPAIGGSKKRLSVSPLRIQLYNDPEAVGRYLALLSSSELAPRPSGTFLHTSCRMQESSGTHCAGHGNVPII
jgi:hypothetical protein